MDLRPPDDASVATPDADPTAHPKPVVPDVLFDDQEAETRWRARYSAPRIGLPSPSRDDEQRAIYLSNESGTFELYCWDLNSDKRLQVTDRPDGTINGTLSANGMGVWWFDDTSGDEFGSWKAQPFGSSPGSGDDAIPGVAPGYPAGLEVGVGVVLAGFSDDDGSRIHLVRQGSEPTTVYRHETDASVGALSADETIWVLEHTEHGDSRYPSLRALSVADGTTLGELDDSPGRGLSALEFSPVAGDQRVLVGHERDGRDELLIWDLATGAVTEISIDLPGDLSGGFTCAADALLVLQAHHGRSALYHLSLSSGVLTPIPSELASIDGLVARDDGSIWVRGSSAATPSSLVSLSITLPEASAQADARSDASGPAEIAAEPDAIEILRTEQSPNAAAVVSSELSLSPETRAPASEPVHDVWVDGPGGRIHALLAVPAGVPTPQLDGGTNVPVRTVFLVHGGPDAADDYSFDAERALWLDAGFAVVQVNYRGSSGYGSQWRDALTARVGHTELADIAAVQDHLMSRGLIADDQCVIAGGSWGGFLTLLALGAQPSRWIAGIAGVPVADYPASYEQEMEGLRAYDRALFGGSPQEVAEKYLDSSPLTWVSSVQAPVLVLAGRNDPRCPFGQIENYLQELSLQHKDYALYSYDAGHSSMVVRERMRQKAVEVRFVLDVFDARAALTP
ncbi:prolyl oligopeptidase family serine peptidase [Nakamurella sp. A5-74]|uniref:Prolyl oligopeptidase family serine peptidase n=1 Tax=Nakamurella sp. A5-74 TaxID=3158264 RepID=A0AAU8DSY4_9ACTN